MKLETWEKFASSQNGQKIRLTYAKADIEKLAVAIGKLINSTTDQKSKDSIELKLREQKSRIDKALEINDLLKQIVRSDYYNEPLISESEQRQISWNEEVIASEPEEIDWNEDNEVPF